MRWHTNYDTHRGIPYRWSYRIHDTHITSIPGPHRYSAFDVFAPLISAPTLRALRAIDRFLSCVSPSAVNTVVSARPWSHDSTVDARTESVVSACETRPAWRSPPRNQSNTHRAGYGQHTLEQASLSSCSGTTCCLSLSLRHAAAASRLPASSSTLSTLTVRKRQKCTRRVTRRATDRFTQHSSHASAKARFCRAQGCC